MKKLALIAGAAALVFPAASYANTTYKSGTDSHYVTHDMKTTRYDDGSYRLNVTTEQDFRTAPKMVTSYMTIGGEKITIDGKSVYKVDANGNRFFAPNGSYAVRNGQTIVVEDGQLDRIEQPAEVVMMDNTFYSHR